MYTERWWKLSEDDKLSQAEFGQDPVADVSGTGVVVLNGKKRDVGVGDVIRIPSGCKHTIKAETDVRLIEVQMGQDIDVKDKTIHQL